MELESRRAIPLKFIIAVFFILNLIVLDIIFLNNLKIVKSNTPLKIGPVMIADEQSNSSTGCSSSCLSQIYQATSSIKLIQPTPITNSKNSKEEDQIIKTPVQPVTSIIKEFYIPLGSGSNDTSDWVNVAAISATIDTSLYGQIKKVTFEASVHIPTGNETAYVRLFNVTDKHPVWFSELSITGGDSRLLTSDPITLDAGNKLYQVQMKTTLKYAAILDQSRVHIITY